MAKKPTAPIKVTAWLEDGRLNSTDGMVMLDGILYHGWFCKNAPQVLEGIENPEYSGYIGLPLRQLKGNRWAASRGIYEEIGQTVESINKRPDFFKPGKMEHLDIDKGLISESVGKYRAYRIPQIIRTIKEGKITFWAMGHKDEVAELLMSIQAAGKKYAAGYGIIKKWEVTDCDEDYSLWHPEHGLMRPVEVDDEDVPKENLQKYPVLRYGIKPPYWKEKNHRLCYVPL